MARIGAFGNLVFSVSDKTIKTFDNMKWDFSAKYATHDRHIMTDLLEYQGPEIETISFGIEFSAFLGVDPMKEIKKLREMVRNGYIGRLVIGSTIYGSYKWVIQKGTIGLQYFDQNGKLLSAKADVILKEYSRR